MKRIASAGAALLLLASIGFDRSALAQDEELEGDIPTSTSEEIVRGLSWDVVAGGIPSSGSIGHAEIGFSGLPRAAYHYTLVPDFSIGGLIAFDYGTWVPDAAFAPSLVLAVPLRYALFRDESMSIALRADPGLVFGFDPTAFGFQLTISGVIGFQVEDRFVIGGGLDFPLLFGARTAGTDDGFFLAMPILIGPVAEFHITPPLAITLDAKVGPAFQTGIKPLFALKLHAGIAMRF